MQVLAGHALKARGNLFIGHGLSAGRSFPLFARWFAYGEWDDSVLTSDEWRRFSGWKFLGVWDDAAPTSPAGWATPTGDGNIYSVWDDAETTP